MFVWQSKGLWRSVDSGETDLPDHFRMMVEVLFFDEVIGWAAFQLFYCEVKTAL